MTINNYVVFIDLCMLEVAKTQAANHVSLFYTHNAACGIVLLKIKKNVYVKTSKCISISAVFVIA